MVGIAAPAAGGSSAGTLHLSRRRAGGRPGCAAPSAQRPRGPRCPPRAAPPPDGPRTPELEEETTKVVASAALASSPGSRRGGGSARGGARVPTPGEGSPRLALTRSRGSPAGKSGEGRGESRENLLRPAPPRPAPGRTIPAGEGWSAPSLLFTPRAPSLRLAASARPVLAPHGSDSAEVLTREEGPGLPV
ncbi:translation initiation factor IF-2-like [Acinonyx jubatus]|uniref:Translation initiation factor IF-2-like n=1 Tax=Acinonyx jubatus TaxID=32536 RepID=A0ABM3PNY5_ACIJB|nr:translation initiation factor IF-2-like [Acinonyx jubatus]